MMRSPYPCPLCRLRLWMRPCRLSCYLLASSRLHLSLPWITTPRKLKRIKYRDVESSGIQYTSSPQVERPPATCSLVSAKKRDHLPSRSYPIGSAGRVNHVYDAGRHPPRRGRTHDDDGNPLLTGARCATYAPTPYALGSHSTSICTAVSRQT